MTDSRRTSTSGHGQQRSGGDSEQPRGMATRWAGTGAPRSNADRRARGVGRFVLTCRRWDEQWRPWIMDVQQLELARARARAAARSETWRRARLGADSRLAPPGPPTMPLPLAGLGLLACVLACVLAGRSTTQQPRAVSTPRRRRQQEPPLLARAAHRRPHQARAGAMLAAAVCVRPMASHRITAGLLASTSPRGPSPWRLHHPPPPSAFGRPSAYPTAMAAADFAPLRLLLPVSRVLFCASPIGHVFAPPCSLLSSGGSLAPLHANTPVCGDVILIFASRSPRTADSVYPVPSHRRSIDASGCNSRLCCAIGRGHCCH